MTEALELAATIQELRVAEEELRAQNEELLAAQTALDQERQRYADLFEAGPDAFLVTDQNGKLIEANAAAADLLGVRPDELPRKVLASFVPVEGRRAFRTFLIGLIQSRGAAELDLRIRTRSGRETIVHARAVFAEKGEEPELRWALRDVTEQRSAEAELQVLNEELEARVAERGSQLARQQALLEAVVQQIPLGLAIVDESEQLVLANTQAQRILGRSTAPSDAEGHRPDGTPYAPDEWPIVRSLRHGEVVIGERPRIVVSEGKELVVEVNSGPIRDRDGKIVAAVAVFSDVTAAERRERAEREFVSNAAHELRTPLAAIVGAVEVLQAGAKDEPAERDRFLAHLERQCRRLERLTSALLVLARVQTGAEEPRLEIVELCPLLEDLTETVHPSPRVRVEVACPEDLAVFATRELLEEALVNLLSNAAKYTRSGTIAIETVEREEVVEIVVRDTGRGMEPEDRERALERFYRGGNGDGGGFGLGLAIAAEAVKAMGSRLELHSTPGGGTTARMFLRAARVVAA